MCCLGLAQIHMVRVRKKSWFGLKYLYQSPQLWKEMVWLCITNTRFWLPHCPLEISAGLLKETASSMLGNIPSCSSKYLLVWFTPRSTLLAVIMPPLSPPPSDMVMPWLVHVHHGCIYGLRKQLVTLYPVDWAVRNYYLSTKLHLPITTPNTGSVYLLMEKRSVHNVNINGILLACAVMVVILLSLYWREGRQLYSWYLQNSATHTQNILVG